MTDQPQYPGGHLASKCPACRKVSLKVTLPRCPKCQGPMILCRVYNAPPQVLLNQETNP